MSKFALADTFPVSFYGQGLAERATTALRSLRSCIPTGLNVLTILFLFLTVSSVAGIYRGATAALEEWITSSQLAQTISVHGGLSERQFFEDPDIAALAAMEFEEAPGAVAAAFGWNESLLQFHQQNGRFDGDYTKGRTIHPEDPLFERLELVHQKPGTSGSPFGVDEAGERGIGEVIVDQSLLRALEYDADFGAGPAPLLHIAYGTERAALEVVGVCRSLMGGQFLITEDFNRQYLDFVWDPNPKVDIFFLGPLSVDIGRAREVVGSEAVGAYLGGPLVDVTGEAVRRQADEVWFEFRHRREAQPWSWWREVFGPTVAEELEFAGIEDARALGYEHGDFVEREVLSRREPEYLRAAIYVRTLDAVPLVVDRIEADGYRVSGDPKGLALFFQRVNRFGGLVLLAVIAIVGSLSAISIGLSFAQSIQRKVPEIGILKAYGTGNHLVLLLYLIEAFALWFLATAIGFLLLRFAAGGINETIQGILIEKGLGSALAGRDLLSLPLELLSMVAGGALLLCWTTTAVASAWATRIQPASALRGI